MKTTAILITVCLGLIFISGYALIKNPVHGYNNLGYFCMFFRKAAPAAILISCVLISFTAVKFRWLSVIGNILMIGAIAVGYLLERQTGASIGTLGWTFSFVSIFTLIPWGILLSCCAGTASLIRIISQDNRLIVNILMISLVMAGIGAAYHISAGIQPDIHRLITTMKTSSSELDRISAAVKLSEINSPEKVPLLIDLLTDQHPGVRQAVIIGLSGTPQKNTGQAAEPLLNALQHETDLNTRKKMVEAIRCIAPLSEPAVQKRSADILIAIIEDQQSFLRAEAAGSIGLIKDPRAIGPLIDLLETEPFHAHNALIRITGEHLEPDPKIWKDRISR